MSAALLKMKKNLKPALLVTLWVVWIGLLLQLGSGCSLREQANAPVEGGNPVLTARALESDNKAAKNATVIVMEKRSWLVGEDLDSAPAETLFTDTAGRFELMVDTTDTNKIFGITITSGNLGFFEYVQVKENEDREFFLKPLGVMKGTVAGIPLAEGTISFPGYPGTVTVDSTGMWQLNDVPAASLTPILDAIADTSLNQIQEKVVLKTVMTRPGEVIHTTDTVLNFGSVLLEDFEDRTTQGELAEILTQNYWTSWNDISSGGTSTITPYNGMDAEFYEAIHAKDAYHGNSLNIEYDLVQSEYESGIANVSLIFVPRIDLSGMDSLVFWCKGQGEFKLQIGSHGDYLNPKGMEYTWKPSEDWNRVVVKPEMLTPVDPKFGWDYISSEVGSIGFLFTHENGPGYLVVDELRVFGF